MKEKLVTVVDRMWITVRQRLMRLEDVLAAKLGLLSREDKKVILTDVAVTVKMTGEYRHIVFDIIQTDNTRGPMMFEWKAYNCGQGYASTYEETIKKIKRSIDCIHYGEGLSDDALEQNRVESFGTEHDQAEDTGR